MPPGGSLTAISSDHVTILWILQHKEFCVKDYKLNKLCHCIAFSWPQKSSPYLMCWPKCTSKGRLFSSHQSQRRAQGLQDQSRDHKVAIQTDLCSITHHGTKSSHEENHIQQWLLQHQIWVCKHDIFSFCPAWQSSLRNHAQRRNITCWLELSPWMFCHTTHWWTWQTFPHFPKFSDQRWSDLLDETQQPKNGISIR